MEKLNCWQYMKCGREPGGEKAAEVGVCPATTEERLEGINGGLRGGRACWGVEGTNCPGTFAEKFATCLNCAFFQLVAEEERRLFVVADGILERLKGKTKVKL